MADREQIEDLVADFLERRDSGEVLDADSYSREHPEAGADLTRALRAALETEALFPAESPVGRPARIGPWRVVDQLGRGGAGRVFRVVDAERPDREYALKLLELAAFGGSRALERFRREGAILEALEHEGIVRVREVAKDADPPYLVMELVEGPSLSEVVGAARIERRTTHADTPPTDDISLPGDGDVAVRAASLAARLARAVEFAHGRGLLHRDLKPSNVLLAADGHPVLADFGLAVHEDSATLTASGDVLGTPNYMAPEQARGRRADVRTDVWGIGAVLYELLTLNPPHGGRETLEVLERIKRRPVRPVHAVNPAVPRDLSRIVHRALAWRPARRYPSAAELADDLEAFTAGRPIRAGGRGPVEWAEDVARFHPRAVTAVGLVLLCGGLLGGLGAGALRGGESREVRAARLERALDLAWLDGERAELERPASELLALDPDSARAAAFLEWASGGPARATGDEAVDLFMRAAVERAAQRYDAALDLLDDVVALDPGWGLPVAAMGLTAYEAADTERAVRELTAARRLLPQSRTVAIDLAYLLRDRGRPEDAVDELRRVLFAHPDDEEAWSDLAASLQIAGRSDEALEAIETALKLAGEPELMMLNRKAAILDALGRGAEAKELFRELLERRPGNTKLLANLAHALDRECLLGEAREAYTRVLVHDPEHLQALVSLANLHAGSNRDECAACRRAFDGSPELYDPDAAVAYLIEALEVDRGRTSWLPDYSVDVAARVDRAADIRPTLASLVDDEQEVDARVVRIERALRKLDTQARSEKNGSRQ